VFPLPCNYIIAHFAAVVNTFLKVFKKLFYGIFTIFWKNARALCQNFPVMVQKESAAISHRTSSFMETTLGVR